MPWGHETDLQVALGWPAKPGDPAPQGLVTVRISHTGAATAELIARAPLTRPAGVSKDEAKTRLQKDYGFIVIEDNGTWSKEKQKTWEDKGVKAWNDQELNDVLEALRLVPVDQQGSLKTALTGVELIRVASIGGGGAGLFFAGSGAVAGNVAEKPYLALADRSFDYNAFQFFGDSRRAAPSCYQTILHEVGHAVEKAPHRAAMNAVQERERAITKALVPEALVRGFRDRRDAAKKASIAALGTANESFAHLSPTDEQASAWLKYKDEINQLNRSIMGFESAWRAKGASLGVQENDVIKKKGLRDEARKIIVQGSPPGAPAPVLAVFDPAAAAQDDWFEAERVFAWAPSRTRRVQRFVDRVNADNVKPFTWYAQVKWPYNPADFYADAYSLWLVDPGFLETNYPTIYEFFQSGDYLVE